MSRLARYGNTDALDSAVLDALRQGIQHTVLSRTRLRKGGQAQKVQCIDWQWGQLFPHQCATCLLVLSALSVLVTNAPVTPVL